MAGKRTRLDTTRPDDDLFNLDDMDWDDDFSIDPAKGPVGKFFSSATRSAKDSFSIGSAVKKFMLAALPEGYSRIYGATERTAETLVERARRIVNDNAGDLNVILSTTDKIMPALKTVGGEKFANVAEDRIKRTREKLRDIESAKRLGRSPTPTIGDEVAQTLESIGMSQENNANLRFKAERTERGIRDKVEGMRHRDTTGLLGSIDKTLSQGQAFTEQVTYKFQRKSIELQFRQAHTLGRILQHMEIARERDDLAYAALTHNTALSEHAKHSAAIRRGFGNYEFGRVNPNNAPKNISDYFSTFFGNITEKFTDAVGNAIRQAAIATTMGGAVGSQLNDPEMLGSMVGGEGSNLLGGWLATRFGKGFQKKGRRLSRKMGGLDNKYGYMFDNAPALLNRYVQNYNSDSFTGEFLRSIVSGLVPGYMFDDSIKSGGYATMDQPAPFREITNRSIVEVIPGYLSRILQELRISRTGNLNTDREVYDHTKGRFTIQSIARDSQLKRIITEGKRVTIDNAMGDAMGVFDRNKSLSPAARKALRERILRDASSPTGMFNAAEYYQGGWGSDVSDETAAELRRYFGGRFKFEYDEDGRPKLKEHWRNYERQQTMSSAFNRLRESIPEVRDEIRRVMESGNGEWLRELGLVVTEQGVDKISEQAILRLLTEGMKDTQGQAMKEEILRDPFSIIRRKGEEYKSRFESWMSKKGSDFKSRAQNTAAPMYTNLRSMNTAGGDSIYERMRKRASEFQGKAKPFTAYLPGATVASITEAKVAAGEYIDAKTGTVISRIQDIQGTVLNRHGRVVLHESELANGLVTEEGVTYIIAGLKERLGKAAKSAHEQTLLFGNSLRSKLDHLLSKASDIFVDGEEKPAIYGNRVAKGEYLDVNTQRVLQNIDDITGEVRDKDGNVVLTDQDFEVGIRDVNGRKNGGNEGIASVRRLGNKVRNLGNSVFNFGLNMGKAVFNVGVNLGKKALGLLGIGSKPVDAWIHGESVPRISVVKLRNGEYFDEKGEPILKMGEITGRVFDRDRNIVLDKYEARKLVDIEGNKHSIARKNGRISRMARAYGGLSRSYYGAVGRGAKALGGAGMFIGRTLLRPFGFFKKKKSPVKAEDIVTPTEQLLNSVYEVLEERLPQPEHRVGSWQDQLKKMNESKKTEREKAEAESKEEERQSPMAKLMASLKGLFGGRGDDADDDGGDTTIIGGGLDDLIPDGDRDNNRDNNRNNRNRRGPRGPRGGGGKWGWIKGLFNRGAGNAAQSAATNAVRRGLLARAMPWIGRGLMMGGTVLAGTIGLPATLAIGAVIAAGAGLTYLTVARKNIKGEFTGLRLMQYGVRPSDWSQSNKVMDMERELLSRGSLGPNGFSFRDRNADYSSILSAIGVDVDDEEEMANFRGWFENRFLPVMQQWGLALQAISPGTLLNSVDDNLTEGDKKLLLAQVSTVKSPTALRWQGLPFGVGEVTKVDKEMLDAKVKELTDKYDKTEITNNKNITTEGMDAVPVGPERKESWKYKLAQLVRKSPMGWTLGSKLMSYTPIGWLFNKLTKSEEDGGILERYRAIPDAQIPVTAQLKPIKTMRFHAYGLTDLQIGRVTSMVQLEQLVSNLLLIDSKGSAKFTGTASSMLEQSAGWFGISMSDSEAVQRWMTWFNHRFLPVYINYYSAVKNLGRISPTASSDNQLSPQTAALIAKAIMATVVDINGESISIWKIHNLAYEIDDLGAPEEKAKKVLAFMEKESANAVYKSEAENTSREASEGSNNSSITTYNPVTDARRRAQERWGGNGQILSSSNGTGYNGRNARRNGGGGNVSGPVGNAAILMQAHGGAVDQIPMPARNRDRNAAIPTLQAVSKITGVPLDMLMTFAAMESSFDYNARPSGSMKSNALGWFQFVPETWESVIKLWGHKYGLTLDGDFQALRADPRLNALMAAELYKDNARILANGLGRAPTDTEIYMAHFLGAPKGLEIIKMNPDVIPANLWPRTANSNPPIFYRDDAMRDPYTAGEILANAERKVSGHRSAFQRDISATDLAGSPTRAAANEDIGTTDVSSTPTPSTPSSINTGAAARAAGAAMAPVQPSRPSAPTEPASTAASSAAAAANSAMTAGVSEEDLQRSRAANAAAAADRQQQRRVSETMEGNRSLVDLNARQLAVQEEMRDYLKAIAGDLGVIRGDRQGQPTNDTSRPMQASAGRPGGGSPPISMNR